MADAMYPANSVTRKIFPTCTGFTVTKFDPSIGYRETEPIENESGDQAYYVGVDFHGEYEVEMVVHPNTNIPLDLTNIQFTNCPAYVAQANANNLSMLINGGVKLIGNAGRVLKIGFKGLVNANLP
jgi:hypothetical protein